jgi:hypothetical protein
MGICCKQQRHLSPKSNAMHPAAQSHPDAGKQIYRFSGLVQWAL